jgi:uncharacterized membrane protein (UPF0127 family)
MIRVELAATWWQRFRGLSGRESLNGADGMLFIFPWRARWRMCMRGMKFPLDFIWMNDGKIVAIDRNIQPGRAGAIRPPKRVNMVLEARCGLFKNIMLMHLTPLGARHR